MIILSLWPPRTNFEESKLSEGLLAMVVPSHALLLLLQTGESWWSVSHRLRTFNFADTYFLLFMRIPVVSYHTTRVDVFYLHREWLTAAHAMRHFPWFVYYKDLPYRILTENTRKASIDFLLAYTVPKYKVFFALVKCDAVVTRIYNQRIN